MVFYVHHLSHVHLIYRPGRSRYRGRCSGKSLTRLRKTLYTWSHLAVSQREEKGPPVSRGTVLQAAGDSHVAVSDGLYIGPHVFIPPVHDLAGTSFISSYS